MHPGLRRMLRRARLGSLAVLLLAPRGDAATSAPAAPQGGGNAANGLYARPLSSTSIQLTWQDPSQDEIGFRIERSLDGLTGWVTVTLVGPDTTGHTVSAGLATGTLHYFRLVTRIAPGVDSGISNLAAASTFPATAATVCATRVSGARSWARFPSAAWNGAAWGVAWQEKGAAGEEILFQRFSSVSLSPLGSPVNVSQSDAPSALPTVAWNGSRFGVAWYEGNRGEPGVQEDIVGTFALLRGDGSVERRGVRIDVGTGFSYLQSNFRPVLTWDGTHWGYWSAEGTSRPFSEVVYRRLSVDGDKVLGPVAVTATPGHFEYEIDAAFGPGAGAYGVAWLRILDGVGDIYFQLVEETTGAAVGAPALLGTVPAFTQLGLTVTWDAEIPPAGGWAVTWTQGVAENGTVQAVFLRRVDAAGTPLGLAPARLSDDANPASPVYDVLPQIVDRPAGELVVVTQSYSYSGQSGYQLGRLRAAASGERSGARALLTPDDGRHASWPRVAPGGDRFLVVWNHNTPGTLEAGGQVHDAAGVPGPVVALTSGHTAANGLPFVAPASPQVAPVADGFAVLWSDAASGTNRTHVRVFDGSGTPVGNDLVTAPSGNAGIVGVGDTFAVAFNDGGGNLVFARYGADGNPVVPEAVVATGAGGNVTLAFSGERYAAVLQKQNSLKLQLVTPAGVPDGPLRTLAGTGVRGPAARVQWTGDGWAVLYRAAAPEVRFLFADPTGASILAGPTVLTPPAPTPAPDRSQMDLVFDGQVLGVAWADRLGPDPPGQDIFFTVVDRAGNELFTEQVVVGSVNDDGAPRLYLAPDGTFRLLHSQGTTGGLREIGVQVDGSVLPGERFWTNHLQGAAAVAFNGATLGVAWLTERELHFATAACAEDATPPPCPSLAVDLVDADVRLAWSAAGDPASGIWRQNVYRDGGLLAQLGAGRTSWIDAGHVAGVAHSYELRPMNGAFQESEGCAPVVFTTPLFADGFQRGDVSRWSASAPP